MARVALPVSTAAVAVAITLASCGPLPGAVDTPTDVLKGDWIACLNAGNGSADQSQRIVFYPDSFSKTTQTYATTDRTCGGAATGKTSEIWRYKLTGTVSAQIGAGGTVVPARQIDIANSFVTVYSIVFADETANPARLYFGDLALDPAQDGSAPSKRPSLLSASSALTAR